MAATIQIGPDRDPAARDRFVLDHPHGTFCHLSAWSRAVRRGFGLETPDLIARRGEDVAGVLPLGAVMSRIFGRRLVSSPFGVYGGPLADGADARDALLGAALDLAESLGVGHVEVRGREEGPETWPAAAGLVTFRGPIGGSDAEILSALPRKTRAAVRAGRAAGFVPEASADRCDDFYRLFAAVYRDHGTPVAPKRWIRALLEEFGESCVLFSLRDGRDGKTAASVLTFLHGDEIAPYYVGARRQDYARQVNPVLYFELMRWGLENGFNRFDFGRSRRGSGSYDFKRRWGFPERELRYRFRLVRDRRLPDLSPTNPRYARRIAVWRKLPLWAANRLGPLLSAGLA